LKVIKTCSNKKGVSELRQINVKERESMFFHDNGGSLLQIGNQRDCLTPLLLVREKYS